MLFCLSGTWAQGESKEAHQGLQTSGQTSKDIWDELRALRDMVVEQRVELRNTKAELQAQRDKVAVLEKQNKGSKLNRWVMLRLVLQGLFMKIMIIFIMN